MVSGGCHYLGCCILMQCWHRPPLQWCVTYSMYTWVSDVSYFSTCSSEWWRHDTWKSSNWSVRHNPMTGSIMWMPWGNWSFKEAKRSIYFELLLHTRKNSIEYRLQIIIKLLRAKSMVVPFMKWFSHLDLHHRRPKAFGVDAVRAAEAGILNLH